MLSRVLSASILGIDAHPARNQLIRINGPDMQASFKYDALGRRIEKTINGKTTQYLYDGLDIIQEIENGMVSANYIRTLNIDEPLARIKSDGTIRYYQQDAIGSVVALTDETGLIKTQYIYDPFGNTTVSGESSDNPFQYTGRENDNTGLYHYRARYYDAKAGRFISEDPIRMMGGDVNLYGYVRNNPINYIDPWGLVDWGKVGTGIFLEFAGYGYSVLGAYTIYFPYTTEGPIAGLHTLPYGIAIMSTGGFMWWQGYHLIYEGFTEPDVIPKKKDDCPNNK